MRFWAVVKAAKGGGHYVDVPDAMADANAMESRARVKGTFDDVPFRSSLMPQGRKIFLGVHKATLAAAGRKLGDRVDVIMEHDFEQRPGDVVPDFFGVALGEDAVAQRTWEGLGPTHRREFILWVTGAKKEDTRRSRVAKMLVMLREHAKLLEEKARAKKEREAKRAAKLKEKTAKAAARARKPAR